MDYARARRVLMRRDPTLRPLIRRVGPCRLGADRYPDHLTALAASIISQQLSGKAAATIFGRFLACFPGGAIPDAAAVAALADEPLGGAGLSRQKIAYLRDLSTRLEDGRLALNDLNALSDEAVIARLTTVKGIGRWTAEMFLMFRLHRPDVLPVDDLGIVTAVQALYRLRTRPDEKRLRAIAEAWRPYRSVACWYLWRSRGTLPEGPVLDPDEHAPDRNGQQRAALAEQGVAPRKRRP